MEIFKLRNETEEKTRNKHIFLTIAENFYKNYLKVE